MNYNSYIADVVNRINAGNRNRVRTVKLNINKKTMEVLYIFLELGLIRGYKMQSNNEIWVSLRFHGGSHIFNRISLVSKPSKRIYWNMSQLYKEIDKNNAVIYLISTKEGILIGSDCIWRALTGEVLIKIVF